MKSEATTYLNNTYSCSDFAVGVSLLYFNVPLLALERDNYSDRVAFCFERTENLDSILQSFWEDTLQVSPKRWHILSRELKSRITEFNRGNS